MFDDPRWGDDPRDRDDREHDRDHDDGGPHLGRGPTSRGDISETNTPDRDDERWPERDRDPREDEHVLPVLQSEAAAGMDAVLEPGMGLNLVWPAAVTDQTVVP